MKALDVSAFQGKPNWAQVKADGYGLAMIRATDSSNLNDPQLVNSVDVEYQTNYAGAVANLIVTGSYHVFDPTVSVPDQATLFLNTIGKRLTICAVDVEDTVIQSGLSPSAVLAAINQWTTLVTASVGRPCLVYMGVDTINWLGATFPYLWLADPSNVAPQIVRVLTQTGQAQVNGITGPVDQDNWTGTSQQLALLLGDNMPPEITVNKPPVCILASPTGQGYGIVCQDGGVFSFGDFVFEGSEATLQLAAPIISATMTPTGKGYWLMGADGGVFALGDAQYLGRVVVK